jgi:hypothetical protein
MDILLKELFYGWLRLGLVPEVVAAMWRGYPVVEW